MAGRYRVKRSIALEGDRRILLYFWGHIDAPRIRNLVCVDADDVTVWRAELPASTIPNCFVSAERVGDVVEVRTYSGHALTICVSMGATLS